MTTTAYAATHDALTHLPNEFLFMDRLNQLVRTSERGTNLFAVLIMLPDTYDKIYQVHGQAFVDQLIRQIAERLQTTLREPDTVTRRKDNAFAILIPQIDSQQGLDNLVNRISKSLAQPFKVESSTIHMAFSMGKAIYPYDGSSATALMKHAEKDLPTVQKA